MHDQPASGAAPPGQVLLPPGPESAPRTEYPHDGFLTPEDVSSVAFSEPPRGRPGYNENEVDQFLDLVEAALQDPPGNTLTLEDVLNVAFSRPPRGKRGYNENEVDQFLDLVAQKLEHRATGKDT
ncbi:MAG: DivIVA domain-containing protein [Mycobacterium sp.]|nr:DivIVA domain-containing protein [Mycobacterium sp.]